MTFLIQQTMIYAVPLMIVALAGVFAERSGIINLALEGIMILGAFIGVLFVNIMQTNHVYDAAKAAGDWVALQGFELLAMLVAAIFGAIFSLLLSFASVNLRADQTIGGTALNLMAPALVLFLIRIIANQNTLQMATGDAASWFMIKKTTLGYAKTDDLGFLGNTFLHKVYLATYICIIIFVVLSILLYKTRFGLRLRSCGENPQAADSVGINVYKMRWAGVLISGVLGGLGGKVGFGLAGERGVVAEQALVVVGVHQHGVERGGVLLAGAHHLLAAHLLLGLLGDLHRGQGRARHLVGGALDRVFHLAFEP